MAGNSTCVRCARATSRCPRTVLGKRQDNRAPFSRAVQARVRSSPGAPWTTRAVGPGAGVRVSANGGRRERALDAQRRAATQACVTRTACCMCGGGAEAPNATCEASTGHAGGRQGDRTPGSLGQPREGQKADGDGLHAPEAYTKASKRVRCRRVCRGPQGLACRERSAENVGDPVGSCVQVGVPNDTEGR